FQIYNLRTRSSIIADAFEAAFENLIDYSTAFDTLQYLEHEKEYLVWKTVKSALNTVADLGNFFTQCNDSTSYKVRTVATILPSKKKRTVYVIIQIV
ncbi:unnamed protein product, partial [Haemonchus placei]|uniref:ERAP1_C domain-containing protein n=1 Tax=Haemonchus placei TaxID=6290 RepID=A0A0N4X4A9_HAEPC